MLLPQPFARTFGPPPGAVANGVFLLWPAWLVLPMCPRTGLGVNVIMGLLGFQPPRVQWVVATLLLGDISPGSMIHQLAAAHGRWHIPTGPPR